MDIEDYIGELDKKTENKIYKQLDKLEKRQYPGGASKVSACIQGIIWKKTPTYFWARSVWAS